MHLVIYTFSWSALFCSYNLDRRPPRLPPHTRRPWSALFPPEASAKRTEVLAILVAELQCVVSRLPTSSALTLGYTSCYATNYVWSRQRAFATPVVPFCDSIRNIFATLVLPRLRRKRVPLSLRLAFHRTIARQLKFTAGGAVKKSLTVPQQHHRCCKRVGRGRIKSGSGSQARASALQGRGIAG